MPGAIQIRQLEYVVALARERHFARAAAACHVSPSALSYAMRTLEAELGVAIVERGRRFGGFTAEGVHVVEWARRMLASRAALRTDLTTMQDGLTATLRIGVIPTAAAVTGVLASAFRARNPLAAVHVETGSTREIRRRLAEFGLDAGIVYLDGGETADVHGRELYREHYVLVTPVDGPLGGRDRVGWADVVDVPLCALTPAMQNRRILDDAVSQAGARLEPAVETDTADGLWAHLYTRRRSSVLAHSWLHVLPLPPGMGAIPLPDLDPAPAIGIITAAVEPASMVASALLDVVRGLDVAAQLDRVALADAPLRQAD